MRSISTLLFILSACLLGIVSYALLVAEPRFSVYVLVGDDAGYYFSIARNFLLGHGLSFDRLHETNGFNPLLTALLIGVYRLFVHDLSVIGCYRAGLMLTLLANLGGLVLLVRLVGGLLDEQVFTGALRRLAIAATTLFFAGFIALKSNYGMDAPLVFLIGLAYLDRVRQHGLVPRGAGAAFVDGALLGMLFLARVDSLPFLVAAFALMAVLALRDRSLWAPVVGRGIMSVAIAAPYLLWSVSHFGAWLPVSAQLKSRFPVLDLPASMEVVLHSSLNPADLGSFALAFVVSLSTAIWFISALRRRPAAELLADHRLAVLAVLAAYLLMRLTYMAMFSRLDVQGSYVILAHAFNLLMASWVVGGLAKRAVGTAERDRIGQLACVLLILVTVLLVAGKSRVIQRTWGTAESGGRGDERALGQAIHASTSATDVIYGGAYGLLGFFADRAWINGDGVANTAEYQRVLENGDLEAYLAENRVTHLVFLRPPGAPLSQGQRLEVRSQLNGRVNYYSVPDSASLLDWYSLRNGGCTVSLARYSAPTH